ncbi:MAG: helix-turn-helix domain-containing protein [Patescibacteria group bacterium]
MLDKIIDYFNLEEKEAKVYLAALELGNSKVSEIAKKAGLNRITAYEILKRLRQKGLAVSLTRNNVLTFRVIDPEKVIKKMESKLSLSRELLPALVLLKNNSGKKPKIEYFDGREGLRALCNDSLNCQEKIIYDLAEPTNLLKTIGEDFFNSFVRQRVKKGIKVKLLLPKNKENKKYLGVVKRDLRELRFIDDDLYPNEFYIYDNKVAILSFSGKMGVLIEDEEIAKSMKSIWRFLWNHSDKNF